MAPSEGAQKIGVMAVCLDPMSYKALTHFIGGLAGAAALGNVERYVGADRDVGRSLDKSQSRICVIDYDQNNEEAIWVTERLKSEFPDVYVFAASASPQPERIIAAMHAGCAEFLLKPLQVDRVVEAITRVEAKQKERVRSKIRGKIVTLIGAKGGTGVTSLALHLALELAYGKKKCLLVDQHPAMGDASLYLGTERHQYGFYELANNTDRLDQELLAGFLLTHESGLQLLDSPESLDAIHYAPPAAVEQTLAFLAETYQFVVVDSPPGLSDATLACIGQSDHVAIVMNAELPAVRNTARYIEHLLKLGYSDNKIRVVLNRHSKKGPLSDDRVEKALRRPISLRVPNSYNEVIRSINAGTPITPQSKSEFAAAMQLWAREVSAGRAEKAKGAVASTNRGVLGLFGK